MPKIPPRARPIPVRILSWVFIFPQMLQQPAQCWREDSARNRGSGFAADALAQWRQSRVRVVSIARPRNQTTLIQPDFYVVVFIGFVGGRRVVDDLVPGLRVCQGFLDQP